MGLEHPDAAAAPFTLANWSSNSFTRLARQVANPSLQPPSYYKQPFHAYRDGNLCWEAAVEMTAAARSVHSVVYDPEGKRLDPE